MGPIASICVPFPGSETLRAEARAEGYPFVEALFEHWQSGENRFDGLGEVFCGYFEHELVVAVGALGRDPYAGPETGRIRRVYVRPEWRNRGVGRALVAALVERARGHFNLVRLRAKNADAARLYERMGFTPIDHPDATHVLPLEAIDGPR